MVKIEGLYNTAFCYTPVLEDAARAQIQSVCDQKEFAGCKIRVMPDVHAGKGCTIGTTMTIRDKIVPGMVGVDIGCGMETVELSEREINFERLDALIRKEIPYGREVRDEIHALNAELDLSQLCCADQVNLNRAMRSIGSLGGGNHFIEVDRAEDGRLFLVVHSGSRHLGTEVANFYQDEGRRALWGGAHYQIKATIDQMKAEGRFKEIQKTITALKREHDLSIPKDLAYVEGALFDDYIHDMKLTQKFAVLNRKAMVDVILSGMGLTPVDEFTTIHNYIDTDAMILRKYTSLNIGRALMCSDLIITLMACVAFGMETGLFCILGLVIKSLLVDMVLENINTHKYFHIITTKPREIEQYITNVLKRGATELHGEGAYTHEGRTVLMTVMKRHEAIMLRKYVKMVDPHAFVLIMNTGEIIGKGFRGTN